MTEAALPAALGIRADGGWDSLGGWTPVGLVISALVLLLKSETHLVEVVLARLGQPVTEDGSTSGGRPLAAAPGLAARSFLRPFHWVEATLLAFAAAVVDFLAGDLLGSRVLLLALLAFAVVAVIGNATSILASGRLRAGDTRGEATNLNA